MSRPLGWNEVQTAASPWTSFLRTLVSVATPATALPTTALAHRRGAYLFNAGTANVFLGDSAVGTSNEVTLFPSQGLFLPLSDAVTLYGRVASGTVSVVIWEYLT